MNRLKLLLCSALGHKWLEERNLGLEILLDFRSDFENVDIPQDLYAEIVQCQRCKLLKNIKVGRGQVEKPL